jgi:hypothetical protein
MQSGLLCNVHPSCKQRAMTASFAWENCTYNSVVLPAVLSSARTAASAKLQGDRIDEG